ncbi:hypothetical protein ACFC26_16140 [Kitasatospora purpeofusca]|uniref:hypothetical protein n=1 Tax=Kitasatospora purpeofusca TaxID=67352 RepID=UPI0035DF6A2A
MVVPLESEHYLPFAVAAELNKRDADAGLTTTQRPLPDCLACGQAATSVTTCPSDPALTPISVIITLSCGHVFAASEEMVYDLADEVHRAASAVGG